MPDYTPLFPRSVSGGDYRLPLYHPDAEIVAARLSSLYESVSLKPEHRALALRLYAELVDADAGIWDAMGDSPIDDNGKRPRRALPPECDRVSPAIEFMTNPKFETRVGFVFRVGEWVQRLEDAYGVTAYRSLGDVQDRRKPRPIDATTSQPRPIYDSQPEPI